MRKTGWRKQEFFARTASLDADRVRSILWSLYAHGTDDVRSRIAAGVDPVVQEAARASRTPEPVDAEFLLGEVNEFRELALAGAWFGGDRRVSPSERSQWRSTFRGLLDEATRALAQSHGLSQAAAALAMLLDLAVQSSSTHYFRSEDPVAALNLVISDRVAVLWRALLAHRGLAAFCKEATDQLLRWESPHGWTRLGDKPSVVQREVPLAQVMEDLLPAGEGWVEVGRAYVVALDSVVAGQGGRRRASATQSGTGRLAQRMERWHGVLRRRLAGSEGEALLARVARHPAFA